MGAFARHRLREQVDEFGVVELIEGEMNRAALILGAVEQLADESEHVAGQEGADRTRR